MPKVKLQKKLSELRFKSEEKARRSTSDISKLVTNLESLELIKNQFENLMMPPPNATDNVTASNEGSPTGPAELEQAIAKLLQDREKPLRILKHSLM